MTAAHVPDNAMQVVDLSDHHAHLDVARLPRSAISLGCRNCGLTAVQHGAGLDHRFERPELPLGYRYLDQVGIGDDVGLRRAAGEQVRVHVTRLDRALVPNEVGLLWLASARDDCFILHPATIVTAA